MIKKHEKIYYIYICYMKYVFYAIDKTIAHSNDLLICFCLTLLKKMLKLYQDNSSTYVNHGKISITDD